MAGTTKFRRYRKRRSTKAIPKRRRFYRKRGTVAGVPRPSGLFLPNKMVMRHRYVSDLRTLNPSGPLAQHFWSANGMFDPDITGVGHQPMGYDQMAVFYNHYNVIGSKITVYCWAESQADLYNPILAVNISDDTTVTTNLQQLLENGRVKWVFCRTNPNLAVQGNSYARLKTGFSPKKFFTIKNMPDNTSLVGAAVGNNPTQQAYFCVSLGHPDGSADVQSHYMYVVIDYLTMWTEPKELAQS